MTWFLVRRLGYTVPILLGVSIVVFVTAKIIPGDPVAALAGPGADPAAVAALRARLGLDASVPVQYAHWLGHALTGDLGVSLARQTPVLGLVADAFANTLILTAFAVVVAVVLGTAIGGVAAARPRGIAARICSGIDLLATSLPQYSVALIFVTYLAAGARWFPVGGVVFVETIFSWPGLGLLVYQSISARDLPVISVPMGFTAAGLPLGAQLAGRPFEEALVLRGADAYQRRTDWHLRRPSTAAVAASVTA